MSARPSSPIFLSDLKEAYWGATWVPENAWFFFKDSEVKPFRTRTRQKDFFFSRSWHPSAFQLFKSNFLGTQ